jgi:hypothetical protein
MAHQMDLQAETECNFIDFSHQSKTMIYTFNIQGTAMPYGCPGFCKARMRNHLIKY